jgi:hypothetical protein
MQNLRIVNVDVTSSTTIDVTFTSSLTSNLVTSNVSIIPDGQFIPESKVLRIGVNGAILSITCQPLTPLAAYYVEFKSLPLHKFTSLHNDAIISEDGISNRSLITAPLSSDNPVNNYLKSYLHDNIYNVDDPNTLVSKYISSLAVNLSRALYDIKQTINENYLSNTIVNEQRVRGDGPFDRLNEEGAYEIIRVGKTASEAVSILTDTYDYFESSPITLQKQTRIETLSSDSIDDLGKFNINSLILNLRSNPVTKLTGLIFTLATVDPIYTYDIPKLGYQILDSRYDQNYASTYVTLSNTQIRLNGIFDTSEQYTGYTTYKTSSIDNGMKSPGISYLPIDNSASTPKTYTLDSAKATSYACDSFKFSKSKRSKGAGSSVGDGLMNIDMAREISTPLRSVQAKKLEVGAGAKINQSVYDDPEKLEFWHDKPESIICINYVDEKSAIKIIEQGEINIEGHKEGFLKKVPVGN